MWLYRWVHFTLCSNYSNSSHAGQLVGSSVIILKVHTLMITLSLGLICLFIKTICKITYFLLIKSKYIEQLVSIKLYFKFQLMLISLKCSSFGHSKTVTIVIFDKGRAARYNFERIIPARYGFLEDAFEMILRVKISLICIFCQKSTKHKFFNKTCNICYTFH